jgi:hypothetical protein
MTTSSYPVVIDAILAGVNGAMVGDLAGVQAWESWPYDEATGEMIQLGEVTWQGDGTRIATIKSGRKHRDEHWSVEFDLVVAGFEGSTPTDPSPARNRAFAIFAAVEDLLADDVVLGLGPTVCEWIEVQQTKAMPRVFEKGYGFLISGLFVCHARLI